MPLTECPDCEKQISDAADSCVHCGRPMRNAHSIFEECLRPDRGSFLGFIEKNLVTLILLVVLVYLVVVIPTLFLLPTMLTVGSFILHVILSNSGDAFIAISSLVGMVVFVLVLGKLLEKKSEQTETLP